MELDFVEEFKAADKIIPTLPKLSQIHQQAVFTSRLRHAEIDSLLKGALLVFDFLNANTSRNQENT
ncbi:8838_t:CDS:2 [Dentiscutata erythropus]|uniref:8838_t:CDS:1 n=1 Tax=Dentiscutata erythropus TaxID=1348616 RepID=A0A9N9BH99_9GLOM|nr:8838_t:CDS:2 [Dentiscutata erythropus]